MKLTDLDFNIANLLIVLRFFVKVWAFATLGIADSHWEAAHKCASHCEPVGS